MALRNILNENDPTLRKKSREVVDFNERLFTLLDDMRHTLIEENGLGLAAPQVGILRRAAIILDPSIDSDCVDEQLIEIINPELISVEDEQVGIEGCLSFPNKYGIVTRPKSVKIRAADRYGNPFEFTGEDLAARAVCHEIDHLEGIVFTDLISRLLTDEEVEKIVADMEAKNNNKNHIDIDGKK